MRSTCNHHRFFTGRRRMTYYTSVKYKFMYCPTNKVGTSSWRAALARLYFKDGTERTFVKMTRKRASNFLKKNFFYQPHKMQQGLETYYKFMFVREPLDRLLSAYRMLFLKEKYQRLFHGLTPHVRRCLDKKSKGRPNNISI